ncbi:unnamed protein product [Leptidea sinapis]|uniref:Chitin-binding type-2 domain-containing protein n=1 Tax=Leptidea sinapis TaxID=189913 RepID=A0A5E4QW82_9NEOP|nr:unnamed protein product [Leptidea sinapis]
MQCDEECSNYSECISACPPETCDNTLDYPDIKAVCEHQTCVEGCKQNKTCPEGSVYLNSSLSECVPRAKCRPVCMTLPDGKVILEGDILEEDACHTCRCSKKSRVCSGQPCPTLLTSPGPTSAPETTPHDEAFRCNPGWSQWFNRNAPDFNTTVAPVALDVEPLPRPNEFAAASPMCSKEQMKTIECRTVGDHRSPKETGLNVECSLERGLVCEEKEKLCPDFEIRVFCDCAPFQCLNSSHPNNPHPHDCSKFYECTPDPANPEQPHTVLKDCPPGLMYHPQLMVCDWPSNVLPIRPECSTDTTMAPTKETVQCDQGEEYSECAFPCESLCDHFKRSLQEKGHCSSDEKCLSGCVNVTKCAFGSLWRDEHTCVPPRDCTCLYDGNIPGGVIVDGCRKCQCIDNQLHCDSSECVTIEIPKGPTHSPMIFPEPQKTVSTIHFSTSTTFSTTPIPVTTLTPSSEYATPTTGYPSSTTGYPSSTTGYPSSTTAHPSSTTGYPSSTTGHPSSTTGYPSPTTGYKIPSTGYPSSTTEHPTSTPTSTVPPTLTTIIIRATESPPPKCDPQNYQTAHSKPAQFITTCLCHTGSWNPAIEDKKPFIQVELPEKTPVYGVVMQGSPLYNHFVTSYEVMYGDDGNVFSPVETPDGNPQIFRGPVDHKNQMKQMFDRPFEAKFPEPLQCTEPLGISAGLPIEMIEVSSHNEDRQYLTLNSTRGWQPLYSTPGEWIMFNFTSPRKITGIKTKGGTKGWVSAFNIMYTTDLTTFNPVLDTSGAPKLFPANFDEDTLVMNEFRPPLNAQYLKVLPIKWQNSIEIRVEPVGCFEPYPVTKAPKSDRALAPCELCPGVPTTSSCKCGPTLYYDGENCVTRDQCPYTVGSMFRGDNCDECICKLGGITDCRPVTQCVCKPDLVPKLSPSCECLCEPCSNGTKICPTSKLCLPTEKWCDGLQDCPDDERDCAVVTETAKTIVVHTEAATKPTTTLATTPVTTLATTEKPLECPKVECPPGYFVKQTTKTHSSYSSADTDLPPPRPRYSYQRFRKGGYAKGGFSKGGFSKTGFSKGGYSKGGRNGLPAPPRQTQAFTLEKPTSANTTKKQECVQFKCVPNLPPPYRPGVTPKPVECSTPVSFCNVTGRTFTTFDGTEYKYDVCYHILARDNKLGAWTSARNAVWKVV